MFSRRIKLFFISDMTSLHTENCQIETEQKPDMAQNKLY